MRETLFDIALTLHFITYRAYALNKTSKRMQDERDKINMILMETYPKL